MRGSELVIEKGTKKGAKRKTYVGSKATERRVAEALKKKKEDEEWVKEQKERADAWDRQEKEARGRMRNKLRWIEEGRKEVANQELRDNIVEVRFETEESFATTQPELPPLSPPIAESLEAEWATDSEFGAKEEEKKGSQGRRREKDQEGRKLMG